MGATSIEWTDRTWNPLTGCTKVSPGCDHCYAKTMHERFHGPGSFDTVSLHPDRLRQPLSWRKPARVFVNSMSDLFHQDVPDEYIEQVWDVMEQASEHTFQVLTKRHARMRAFLTRRHARQVDYATQFSYCPTEAMRTSPAAKWAQKRAEQPWPNVWLGVSVENQQWADIRIPALLDTPAAVRFLSCEPLLGPIRLSAAWLPKLPADYRPIKAVDLCGLARWRDGIDWVIAGGESGPGARPMHPTWARSLRDQCNAAAVPFLFKQWGSHAWNNSETDARRVSKKAAGRTLDGRTWDEYPNETIRPAKTPRWLGDA